VINKAAYGKNGDLFDQIGSDGWRTFNLILFNQEVSSNVRLCPRTTAILRKIPKMQSALFSILLPGARIPPHRDPASTVVRYHLALKVPDSPRCFLTVNDHQYRWREGVGVAFDEAFVHSVTNDTNQVRAVLFVDLLRDVSGIGKVVQSLANRLQTVNPGVKALIKASENASELVKM
jgi:beta-hydroxylase